MAVADRLRGMGWRATYELLAGRVRGAEWAFMNYGYAPPEGAAPPLVLTASDEADRFCIQLYEHVLAGLDLAGADVLEVGSGRGGGCEYVARQHGPRSTTGLDFSATAVGLSRRHRSAPGLRFVRGDAQHMPLPDSSVDVVVNVESSHCYPSVPAFLAEVERVLRPGGVLAFADFRSAEDLPALTAQLAASGLTVESSTDITDGVVAALRLDDDRKATLIRRWLPRFTHPWVRRFAAMQGTRGFDAFASRRTRYVTARLRKPVD